MLKLTGERTVVSKGDGAYPDSLLDLGKTAPEKLYCIGNVGLLESKCLAVVGARKATPYGRSCARRFAASSARCGNALVTGGARGIDTEATRATLDVGGKCIEVLAGGLDHPYPHENFGMFQQIVDNGGVLVAEHDWNTEPRPYQFRNRNRIIAALCSAMLVCECGVPSGTFSAVDGALALERRVMAVPGAITSEQSTGPNILIANGARCVIDEESFRRGLGECGLMDIGFIDRIG